MILRAIVKYPKSCPTCDLVAHDADMLDLLFGWRKMGNTERPQSYCKKCRSGGRKKKTDAEQIRELLADEAITIGGFAVATVKDVLEPKPKKSKPVKTPKEDQTPLGRCKALITELNVANCAVEESDEMMDRIEIFLKDLSLEDLEDLANQMAAREAVSKKFDYGLNQMTGFLADELAHRRIVLPCFGPAEVEKLYAEHYPGDKQKRSLRTKAQRLQKKLAHDAETVERLEYCANRRGVA